MTQTWRGYGGDAARALSDQYESLDARRVHDWLIPMLPDTPATVLDVGAGSGRDAAWLSSLGYEVIAVEPAPDMLAEAKRRHADPKIRWLADALPVLQETYRLGLTFDVILLSAVWMHVPPGDRQRAFRKLVTLLKPGGVLAITLRTGPVDAARTMYPVSTAEIGTLAKGHAARIIHEAAAEDDLGRADVCWWQVALRLADDGTGALPLLRHFIVSDAKSATYKLGLLRAVARTADSAYGAARIMDDDTVSLPLGLVGLIWLRLYKPLIEAGLPQAPRNRGVQGLGFVKDGWHVISELTAMDLRVGSRFTGKLASGVHAALGDAVRTITRMPAFYLTYPGRDEPVMKAMPERSHRRPDPLVLDEAYLRSFGALQVPAHLWRALATHDAWIEPALISEWSRLIEDYAHRQGRTIDPGVIGRAMIWSDPSRGVNHVRQQALDMMEQGELLCVWSGTPLTTKVLDIDHCMPWSAWPCEDLWNLMPAHRRINQRDKRQRLPSAAAMLGARDRILTWWETAFTEADGEALRRRFFSEAAVSLTLPDQEPDLDMVFDGAAHRRLFLRATHQVEEWTP
jgi:SAM-dependent methyltransferase